jgi:ATP-dependent DNA helicase RecQ
MRAEAVTQKRRAELEEMKRYVDHDGCLMEFLGRALDDPDSAPCGRCMNCTKSPRQKPPDDLVSRAAEFLCDTNLAFEPKAFWPRILVDELDDMGLTGLDARGNALSKIPDDLRPESGRVLSAYGDAGWGREVAYCKYQLKQYTPVLVEAVARLVRERWKPIPAPAWVTAVPSLNQSAVRDFAGRLASALGLPFVEAIRKTRPTEPQKLMQNRVQQLRNLLGALEVIEPVPESPVLLVDDVVDSGWTMMLSSVLLRGKGSGPVHPFALAKATPRSN